MSYRILNWHKVGKCLSLGAVNIVFPFSAGLVFPPSAVCPAAITTTYIKRKQIAAVEEQLRTSKEEMERCLGEYDELFGTIQRLSDEFNAQTAANTGLQVDQDQDRT